MPFTTRPSFTSRHGMIRLASMTFVREIFQQSKARRLTLLRVKLHAADVPSRHDRRVARPVLGLAEYDASVVRFAEIRMHEVEERLVFDAFGKFVRPPPLDLIPADLRHAQPFGESPHAPAQEAKPARHAELLRLLKQHLHPDAH